MKLKVRILLQTLSASLIFILLLSIVFFITMGRTRNSIMINSQELGNSAASLSAYALEEQVTEKMLRIAQETALFLEEKFIKIGSYTRATADLAGTIYTRRSSFGSNPLPHVFPGQTTLQEPFTVTAPGINFAAVQNEMNLAGNIADMLLQITQVDRCISTAAIVSESGIVVAMDTYPWPLVPFDSRTSPWYVKAKERGELTWTSVYADFRGRGPAISCGVPFFDRGNRQLMGVAVSTVLLSDFSHLLHSANLGRTGYIFILDQAGLKLFSYGSVNVRAGADGLIYGENFLESENSRIRSLGMSMTLGASGMMELDLDNHPVYAAYAPISVLGWSLGVAIPVHEINIPALNINEQIQALTNETILQMNQNIVLMIGFTAFILLAAMLAAVYLSVRFAVSVSKPILTLNKGVQEVSSGNLNREVRIKTGDELEQLASSFNIMTEKLREHIKQIALTTSEQERITAELNVARQIQSSMLPSDFPPFPGKINKFDLYAEVFPAKEVAGDFYDFFFIDEDHFALTVADVSGKGVPAALYMALTITLIRTNLQTVEDSPAVYLTKVLETVNQQLCSNNITNMFVTIWFGVLEISTGTLFYINAGHNPPLFRKEGGKFEYLVSQPDLVLAGMENTHYHYRRIRVEKGDTLFLYTDGITEAMNSDGTFYGKERLEDFLNTRPCKNLRSLFIALSTDIEIFAARKEQYDDITMLALRFSNLESFGNSSEELVGNLSGYVVKETELLDKETGNKKSCFVLNADINKITDLTAIIRGKLVKTGCPEKIRNQIELVIEEIFVNIAKYSYKGNEPGSCEITMMMSGKKEITLTFTDWGIPFNPMDCQEPDIKSLLSEQKRGGLGIMIVKRAMNVIEYQYHDGMNHLLLKKNW